MPTRRVGKVYKCGITVPAYDGTQDRGAVASWHGVDLGERGGTFLARAGGISLVIHDTNSKDFILRGATRTP